MDSTQPSPSRTLQKSYDAMQGLEIFWGSFVLWHMKNVKFLHRRVLYLDSRFNTIKMEVLRRQVF